MRTLTSAMQTAVAKTDGQGFRHLLVIVRNNTLVKTAATGWGNSGASSEQSIQADGYFEFIADETDTYRMAGLSNSDVNANFSTINYAIFLRAGGAVQIDENGVNKGLFGTYITGDKFKVERTGSTIEYKKNSVTFYTSLAPSAGSLVADLSLYTANATIANANIYSQGKGETGITWVNVIGADVIAGDTLNLDCEARTIGSITYTGELITVDPIDEAMDSASDLTIEVLDTASNRAAIQLAVDVKLYLWAVGTADSDKDLKIWGEISDPIIYGGGSIRFDIISRQAQQWNQSIGSPLLKSDYPGADPDEIGKTLPIIYGEHSDHLCLAIDAGAIDSLWKDLGISGDYIFVSDPSIFPNSGTIQIDDEQITYSSNLKNERKLRIAQRGVNNTTRLSHDKGAVVAEVQTNYDYLIANHPIQKVLNVKVDDVLQSGSDFTVLTNENGKAKIRFTTRPSLKKSVDIEVNDTISMTASQSGHAHAIGAPSVVTQYTTEPNMLITEGGMTTKVGFDGSVVNNRIKFEALPLGAIGGSTYVSLTGNSSINWEIGYWYASGGLFSTRDWHVIVAGKGTWAGRFSGVSNDMWIRKVTSTAYSLYMGRANRDVTYTSSMTETKPPIATIRTGGVSLTGNSVSETVIGKVITCDVIGWPDDGSGSLTGLANGAIAQPRHIIQHLLKTYGLATNAEVQTIDFPSADSSSWVFQMSVRIDEPLTIRDVIKNIEQQSRTIITYTGGRWRMTNRPSSTPNPTPDITILDSNVKRMENGASSMRESRSGLRTLVNKHVYRAGLKSDGAWTLSNVESALTSQSRYGVRQQNIDFAYLFDYDNKITPLIEWLSARESNPNRKILIMDVTAAIYALEVGDVVNYNSTKHSIDLYFECIEIGAKGLTDSTITLEQI